MIIMLQALGFSLAVLLCLAAFYFVGSLIDDIVHGKVDEREDK